MLRVRDSFSNAIAAYSIICNPTNSNANLSSVSLADKESLVHNGSAFVSGKPWLLTHATQTTGTYTAQDNMHHIGDTSGGAISYDLPVSPLDGAIYGFEHYAGSNTITITPNVAHTLAQGSSPSYVMKEPGQFVALKYDANNLNYIRVTGFAGSHSTNHLYLSTDELDADQIDIDVTPSNYTTDVGEPESTSSSHLGAHLRGIGNKIGATSLTSNVKAINYTIGTDKHALVP